MTTETKTSYDIGIDLGTSNCALAYHLAEKNAVISHEPKFTIEQLKIAQLESPGSVIKRYTLPSAIYLPRPGEVEDRELNLPWSSLSEEPKHPQPGDAIFATGRWALQHGSLNPDRIIVSAKSWLCFDQVPREDAILPWQSSEETIKSSPVKISQYLLEHLLDAASFEWDEPDLREKANLVITVPASFDEIARTLTIRAAHNAGIKNVTLLEEPLAAFYAWVGKDQSHWRDQIESNDLILVCDVGGGTSDFSLISAQEDNHRQLQLERVSVGKHLLLGGDNIDLALAYTLRSKLEVEGHSVDQWQMESLRLAAREAKEQLLTRDDLDEIPIAVASRGSSLFASSLSTSLKKEELENIVLEGFFPQCESNRKTIQSDSNALKELGLPFAADPAITAHLAEFLQAALRNAKSDDRLQQMISMHIEKSPDSSDILIPNKILFNGGVFKASILRERVLSMLSSWSSKSVIALEGADLDLSVSRGAAYYAALKREGKGLKIRSGTAQSYYLGIASGMMAIPGYTPPLKGICIVPQGTEEGTVLNLAEKEFGLVTGREAEFQLFSSRERAGDQVGQMLSDANSMLEPAARLTVTLPQDDEHRAGESVPVTLETHISEVGTMKLAMKQVGSDQSWQLEFDLRRQEQ